MHEFELPLRTVSALNMREHWAAKARRVKDERSTAFYLCRKFARDVGVPCIVTMTRRSPGTLDDDNLRGALKGVRDGIADALGIDDRDPRVQWHYQQQKAGHHAVLVRISEG